MARAIREVPITPEKPSAQAELVSAAAANKPVRTGKELLAATTPFTQESRARTWWLVGSTGGLLLLALAGAGAAPWWPLRLALSLLGSLLMVRFFITYHDYMHGAILRQSRIAKGIFLFYAALVLTPAKSWRKSHNYHHSHVGDINALASGTFPIMTTEQWRNASAGKRAHYRIVRHPLTILFGYVTVFAIGICLAPLFKQPSKHLDSAWSFVMHAMLIASLWVFGGFDMAFFVVLLPMAVSSALGAYLFFAQHSFPEMHIIQDEKWDYYSAALKSSSFMNLSKLMHWFTGNIGFHHIHHLNVRIPFYQLPDAMAAIPELQDPPTTSLSLRDIVSCFKSSLWDEQLQRMVSYREAHP